MWSGNVKRRMVPLVGTLPSVAVGCEPTSVSRAPPGASGSRSLELGLEPIEDLIGRLRARREAELGDLPGK
jgi:hypothetical protein